MQSPVRIYEDSAVLVIHKPAGLTVHYDGRTVEPTVVDWLLAHYPDMQGVGEPMVLQDGTVIERPGIVHRLDRDTSGVLITAKTQEAFWHLKAQFQNRQVKKEYRAFVWGKVKDEQGVISLPIGRQKSNPVLWSATRGAKGKMRDAETHWRVLARGEAHTYLALFPKTGRTHQLRVHCKAINHPIVCDKLYAPKQACALGFSHLALHALALELALPTTGEAQRFEAPVPESFAKALALL